MKKIRRGCLLLALLLGLSGCAGLSTEELFQLPEASKDYYDLQAAINGLLEEGLSYQAPASGARREPVQLTDLNGDGVDEAVAFFRSAAGEVTVHVLSKEEGVYTPTAVIDGAGSAVASVEYADVDGQEGLEILLTYQVSESVTQALQVYRYDAEGAVNILTAGCSQYFLADLDGDERSEIVCLTGSGADSPAAVSYYDGRDGTLTHGEELRLSFPYDSLRRAKKGTLADEAGAMLISGVTGDGVLVTDIFVDADGVLRQVSPRKDVLHSASVEGAAYAYPADMDGDGIMEVAVAEVLPHAAADSTLFFALRWYDIDSKGVCRKKALTYQKFDDGWYFAFPEYWDGTVTVREENVSTAVSAVHFYRLLEPDKTPMVLDDSTSERLLTIYVLRGGSRQRYAEEHGLSVLYSDREVVYAAELNGKAQPWEGTITLAQVSERFRMLRAGSTVKS